MTAADVPHGCLTEIDVAAMRSVGDDPFGKLVKYGCVPGRRSDLAAHINSFERLTRGRHAERLNVRRPM